MPQYKFEKNDLYRTFIKSYPSYKITLYMNQAYINNKTMWQGESLPSSGSVSFFETSVNSKSGSYKPFVIVGEQANKYSIYNSAIKTAGDYDALSVGHELTGAYPITASIERNIIISGTHGPMLEDWALGVTTASTVAKVIAARNKYNAYSYLSPRFDFDKYLMISGGIPEKTKRINPADPNSALNTDHTGSLLRTKYINLIEIPRALRGEGIKRGSVDLKYYFTGSLLGRATDKNKDGTLIEVTGTREGGIIGTVMYTEGLILITASYDLTRHGLVDGYLSPVSSSIRSEGVEEKSSHSLYEGPDYWRATASWAHFGSYRSFITSSTDQPSASYAPASSSYIIDFKGRTTTPVLTMMSHAPKNHLNWSNNPTYIEDKTSYADKNYNEIFVYETNSAGYKEVETVTVKNTISSSFCNHSASYKAQTFISKIGVYDDEGDLIAIAKLANPVRKTDGQDYTFKLKLDL